MFDPDPNLTCNRRCSSPFRVSAGCTVATKEVIAEAELAIRSFQMHNNAAPVYIMTDGYSKQYLLSKNFLGPLHIFEKEFVAPASVKKHNDYHRTDAILLKMEVFHLAVQRSGDAVFFDADLVFLAPLSGPNDCEVAVSHNLPCLPAEHDGKLHGFFNAGLVWTCNPKFPGWWKHQYLNTGGFYEQVGMNWIPRLFRTGYFDFDHNYGFWRGSIHNRKVKSLHLHLGNHLDLNMPKFMIQAMRPMRRDVWKRLFIEHKELAKTARKVIGHPEKLFFVHYGKAGGVYVNEHMRKEIVPDYVFYDSWKSHLGRDWTSEELRHIIEEVNPLENNYLHQHHVHITRDDMLTAKRNGWKSFTFLRHPLDVICSLYHWRKLTVRDEGIDWVLKDVNASEMSLEDFFTAMTQDEEKNLWKLPDYIDLIDSVKLFSPDNFSDLTNLWFGYHHTHRDKMNSSGNPGYEEHIKTGLITPKMLEQITSLKEYQEFEQFLKNEK